MTNIQDTTFEKEFKLLARLRNKEAIIQTFGYVNISKSGSAIFFKLRIDSFARGEFAIKREVLANSLLPCKIVPVGEETLLLSLSVPHMLPPCLSPLPYFPHRFC